MAATYDRTEFACETCGAPVLLKILKRGTSHAPHAISRSNVCSENESHEIGPLIVRPK